jgi:hypothetical protein
MTRSGIAAVVVGLALALFGAAFASAQERTAPYQGAPTATVPMLMGFAGHIMNGTKTSQSKSYPKPMKDVVIDVGQASHGSGSYTLILMVKNQSKVASPAMTATAFVTGGSGMQTLQAQPVGALKAGEGVPVGWNFQVLPESAFKVTLHLK